MPQDSLKVTHILPGTKHIDGKGVSKGVGRNSHVSNARSLTQTFDKRFNTVSAQLLASFSYP